MSCPPEKKARVVHQGITTLVRDCFDLFSSPGYASFRYFFVTTQNLSPAAGREGESGDPGGNESKYSLVSVTRYFFHGFFSADPLSSE